MLKKERQLSSLRVERTETLPNEEPSLARSTNGEKRRSTARTGGGIKAEMQAVIYCRVSTKEQTKNLSLPTQERVCREYCERQGVAVNRVFVEEGESAKTSDRTKLIELLDFCR